MGFHLLKMRSHFIFNEKYRYKTRQLNSSSKPPLILLNLQKVIDLV